MQSWFFAQDRKKAIKLPEKPHIEKTPSAEKMLTEEWNFNVTVPYAEVGVRDTVVITGSIPALGEWDYTKAVPLEKELGKDVWSKTITIPNTCEIYYRYAICTLDDQNKDAIIIRTWETNVHPRVIKETMRQPALDVYGEFDGSKSICRGWLTSQTLLQFKFVKNPLKLKTRLAGRLMNIKVTPVSLNFGTEGQIEDSLSTDTTETVVPTGVSVEVATLDNDASLCKLHLQEQFGKEYKPNDILIVNIMAKKPDTLAYLIDFYCYSTRAATQDPPCHVGYTYVLPNMFRPSEGTLELPVTCSIKHRPLGTVNIQYLIINPMPEVLNNFEVSYAKHWDPSWTGLEVGHRGLGASFKKKEGNSIRENTIASLKKAAASGADMLEFDVQLSKDMIPVIYHDFYVCISMKRKKEVDFTEMLELPVKDLTLEHLQKLKVYHLVEGRNHETLFFDDDLEEHQPFPTLEMVLKNIDEHVGFNVELKWTMEMEDGTFELNNPFDMNTYVDKVLEVVLKHAGKRNIVFSCFNPDICTMVRNKQNKYPVMFLTVGITSKYQPYRDPRCLSIPAAVQNAISSDILGIVVHTEDLLRDPTQVKLATDAGLVIFCWGDDNNDKDTIKKLKDLGLHAVIYDKLDEYITKEVKESIFLVEARESQRDIMRLAAQESSASVGTSEVKLATDAGLVIFCWGDDNNDKDTIKKLKDLGLHAVIYDKLDEYITKEVKESIFLVEARESQRDIMRLAAQESSASVGTSEVKLATDAGLVIFCWGDDNNDKDTIKKLKDLGLHAVIYDKLDEYITKEVKESIFLVEARESQRDIMRLAAQESSASVGTSEVQTAPRPFLDLSALLTQAPSTVTSLESLASSDQEERTLKRNREIIACITKDAQVKEQRNSFQGLFPAGDNKSASSKKRRSDDE